MTDGRVWQPYVFSDHDSRSLGPPCPSHSSPVNVRSVLFAWHKDGHAKHILSRRTGSPGFVRSANHPLNTQQSLPVKTPCLLIDVGRVGNPSVRRLTAAATFEMDWQAANAPPPRQRTTPRLSKNQILESAKRLSEKTAKIPRAQREPAAQLKNSTAVSAFLDCIRDSEIPFLENAMSRPASPRDLRYRILERQ